MKIPSSIQQPISRFISRPRFLSVNSFDRTSDIELQVQTILDTLDPIEDPLETLVPYLSHNVVTSVLLDQHDIKSSFRFFNWAMQRKQFRSWVSHNSMIDMLCGFNGFELAWKILEELKRCGRTVVPQAFVVLISAYKKSGMNHKAMESFERMKEFGCRPNTFTYNTILHLVVEENLCILASAVYSQMLKTDCRPNRATYSILIEGYCKVKNFKDAKQMIDEMEERGISPNANIYTIIISGLCQTNMIEEAENLLGQMKLINCRPDSITYHALLNGLCKLGKIEKSLELLESSEKDGFVLGLNGYSCLIDGFFRAGRFDEACDLYRKMCQEDIAPDCVLYTIMIKGFIEAGKVKDAVRLLSEMTRNDIVPDAFCYNTLIKGFRDVGLLEKDELKFLSEMTVRDRIPETVFYSTLIKCYCKLGLLNEAKSLKLKMSDSGCFPDSAACTILISALCKEGLIEEAKKIFEQMENCGPPPNVMTFNALINGLYKAGKLEEAHIWLCKMGTVDNFGNTVKKFCYLLRSSQGSDPNRDSESLEKHVKDLCDKGLFLEAYKLLVAPLVDSRVLPNIFTYNIWINGLCKKEGNVNAARKVFDDLQRKALDCKAPFPDAVTYGTLIDGYQRVNREEDALKVFNEMKKGCAPTSVVYKTLMTGLCRRGKVDLAFSHWLEYLTGLEHLEETKLKVVKYKFESGDVKAALSDLLEMEMRSNMVVDPSPYTILLIGFCQAQRLRDAWNILCVLDDYEITVTPPSCVVLIIGLWRDRKFDNAVEVFQYTLQKGFILVAPVGNLLITYLCSQYGKDEAQKFLTRMEEVGYNLDAYLDYSTKAMFGDPKPASFSFVSDY